MSVTLCCRDATALQTEAAEGALEGMDRVTFALHLAVCPPCQRYRAQLEATVEVLKAVPRDPPKASDVDAVMALLGDDSGGSADGVE